MHLWLYILAGYVIMSKLYRTITAFIISVLVSGFFWVWQKQIVPSETIALLIYTSLLMLVFVNSFVEHYFTKPSDVLATSISILLMLLPIKNQLPNWGIIFDFAIWYLFILTLISTASLVISDKNKPDACFQNKTANFLKDFSSIFGNGTLLYMSVFSITLAYAINFPKAERILLMVISLLLLSSYKILPKLLENKRVSNKNLDELGVIIGVKSNDLFWVKLYPKNLRKALKKFDLVKFNYSAEDGEIIRYGFIADKYSLNGEQWAEVLSSRNTNEILEIIPSNYSLKPDTVYLANDEGKKDNLERLAGFITEGSNVGSVKFKYARKAQVEEGTLLEVKTRDNKTVLYQVVDGITKIKTLEDKNETGLISGEASQIGIWNPETQGFEKYGWVPEISTPLMLASEIGNVEIPNNETCLGVIPNTNFTISANKEELITHHTAILGVTGSGKSVFTRKLIGNIAEDDIKVICIDFTGEYKNFFAEYISTDFISKATNDSLTKTIKDMAKETEKYTPSEEKLDPLKKEAIKEFQKEITNFIDSEDKIAIFELPDLANTNSTLEYMKWFFASLFMLAKDNKTKKRICIVLEEAHTIVPETNTIGGPEKGMKGLVNHIAQIALQGRKYKIGFLVIAQRTANVSKTVLTQCNTIIAFQQFDKTSTDFLANYFGSNLANVLPNLKPRHAVAFGKALKSNMPVIFKVPDIPESNIAGIPPRGETVEIIKDVKANKPPRSDATML